MAEYIHPHPYGTRPEAALFGPSTAWQESELRDVIPLDDPGVRYIIDSITHMRIAGLDMTDPDMLRLAVLAGRRRASLAEDDTELLGSDDQLAEWRRVEERDVALPYRGRPTLVVYYMRLGNRVKIGWSGNVWRRMADFQPEELLATEPGGPAQEVQRHHEFRHLRVVGEWFRYEGTLVEHVNRLRDTQA